jgi:hypothetical protein
MLADRATDFWVILLLTILTEMRVCLREKPARRVHHPAAYDPRLGEQGIKERLGAFALELHPAKTRIRGGNDGRFLRRNHPASRQALASTFIFIRNESDAVLTLTGSKIASGESTSPSKRPASLPPFQVLGLTRGRSWVTYREEWPKIQADIDAGRPSPIGLIQTTNLDIGSNHQVLAYGYKKSGQRVSLYVYDPNEIDAVSQSAVEVSYEFDTSSTKGEVNISRSPTGRRQAHLVYVPSQRIHPKVGAEWSRAHVASRLSASNLASIA